MKKIYTSYYANVKKLEPEMVPVSVSVGKPRYFQGIWRPDLAPTRMMLKMDREEYDRRMFSQLSVLDAKEVFDSLPENAVLLCYEKYGDWCHRRAVAEWFEKELGIVVEEVGLRREETFSYAESCEANKGKKKEVTFENVDEVKEEMPESVKKRLESYNIEPELTLFDFGG